MQTFHLKDNFVQIILQHKPAQITNTALPLLRNEQREINQEINVMKERL